MIVLKECLAEEFERMINLGRRIIPFCAGQALLDFCDRYDVVPYIECIVDNYKCGSQIFIKGYDIPVVSVKDIENSIRNELLVITSMQYADELIEQLDSMPAFDGVTFYISDLFKRKEENKDIVFDKTMEQLIPKRIHYCWFGKAEMPVQFQHNIMTWKEKCPDYEIIRWDETNYDVKRNKYMFQAYRMKRWGFVPDYARLDIINTYGGIYLDTDVELLKSLDELLKVNFFCGFESEKYIALGLGFGAKADNVILKKMMESYDKLDFINSDGTMNLTASPVYQTQVMEKFGLKRNGRTQMNDKFLALSSEYLAPINAIGIGNPTSYSYSIHQYAATWFDKEQQSLKKRLINNYRLVLKRMER